MTIKTMENKEEKALKEILEIRDKTFLSKLKFCAYARNVVYLPHRTLKEFDWFISECIWGKFRKKYPDFVTEWDSMIDTFVKYCEKEYDIRYEDYCKQEAQKIADGNKFESGCGNIHKHNEDGSTEGCSNDSLCPYCQTKKETCDKIQEINKEIQK